MQHEPNGPQVAIVGGGISGLTAAVRLAERGYRVTVYEQKPWVGGNLGAYRVHGTNTDVYTHMFSNFYENFWALVEGTLGLERGEGKDFESRTKVMILPRGAFPNFLSLEDVGSFASGYRNIMSGVQPPRDMVLWVYSMLDLLSQEDFNWDELDRMSVEAFMQSRPYATPVLTKLHDISLMTIWSIHAFETSALAYRQFINLSFPRPSPLTWLLTGDLHTKLLAPLVAKLESLGATIECNREVVGVEVDRAGGGKRVSRLVVQPVHYDKQSHDVTPVDGAEPCEVSPAPDYVILALPPKALAQILEHPTSRKDRRAARVVDVLPQLSQLRRLTAEPVSVVDVYFRITVQGVPREHVQLADSRGDLTFLDLSQAWHNDPNMEGVTVLTVAASDYWAIPDGDEDERGFNMLTELRAYLPGFRLGDHWGDPDSDIDWEKSHYRSNTNAELFTNRPGGLQWQPITSYPEIENLFFAGDCTQNPVQMATVEAAVTSGIQAAQALWTQSPSGAPIELITPTTYSMPTVLAMRSAMTPYVMALRTMTQGVDVAPNLAAGNVLEAWGDMMAGALYVSTMPAMLAASWWSAMARVIGPLYGEHPD